MKANTQINQPTPAPAPSFDGSEFITVDEVARRLGRCRRTVYNWMRRGDLPHYKLGRNLAFRWPEVEASMERFRVKTVESREGQAAASK